MRCLLAALLLLAVPAFGQAQPATEKLFAVWRDLNTFCRGWSGDDKHLDEVCKTRDEMDEALRKLGYCYGKKGQSGAEMTWHKCTANSNR
jgi:hypothetical protein